MCVLPVPVGGFRGKCGTVEDGVAGVAVRRADFGDAQPVFGQRAGLVETDHVDAAERLDRAGVRTSAPSLVSRRADAC